MASQDKLPEGIHSLLDTDLYKLTMQSAVLKYFPRTNVTYNFTNRTPDMKLNRKAFYWLQDQVERLGNITMSSAELEYLKKTCTYLSEPYLKFMETFKLRPSEQIELKFHVAQDNGSEDDEGEMEIHAKGLWVDTILYEIPLLALTSEAYFKFVDRDWSYEGQEVKAKEKGLKLLEHGCLVSEFGSRRRRDYHTHELVLEGLKKASKEGEAQGFPGKITGSSNVHFAMRFGTPPIGTVAHEWFMGVAAITNSYETATETALRYWVGTFGKGVLGIALTDTFGTPEFLKAFTKTIPSFTTVESGASSTLPSAHASNGLPERDNLGYTEPPITAPENGAVDPSHVQRESYAQAFTGVRQDSGSPADFIKLMRKFYDDNGVEGKKTIVFSDSLNVDKCLELKAAAEKEDLQPSFGVGTFFTNDFDHKSNGRHSVPLNIVIKLSSAEGRAAVKISDNVGKNTGDSNTVAEVKKRLGYSEKSWDDGDEATRWGAAS